MTLPRTPLSVRPRRTLQARLRSRLAVALTVAICGCTSVAPVTPQAPAPETARSQPTPQPTQTPAAAPTPTAAGATPKSVPSQPAKSSATFGDSQFRFAEIPEIVFVRGIAERERMGIFHIDTGNRWTPGDLENSSGWKPRVATELDIQDGNLTGVRYDSTTADLSYDGSGKGNETAVVQLDAPSLGVGSAQFRIRVLEPTIAWGIGAATRFPDIGRDSGQVPWKEMQRTLRRGATAAHPNVLFVTSGRYQEDFFISRDKGNLYILGDPQSRPVLVGSRINVDDVETGYLKNFELVDTIINGSKFPTDRPVNVYITQIYQHDSTREQNGISAPDYEGDSKYGIVKAPNSQTHWIWNFHGSQMGSPSNLRHQVYVHGRPDGYLNVNNIRVDGARGCSILKSTKYYNVVRNSRLSALVDPAQPGMGLRADKLIDFASAGETVIYNNELIGAFTQAKKGTQNGLISLRARRGWWGSDTPAYPDVSWDPPTTSIAGGGYLAPKGFTAGPETFVNEAFWSAVSNRELTDPQNEYTFKKYIAFNSFVWIDEGAGRRSPVVDDGTAPRNAKSTGSAAENWGSVPHNWVERSVTFLANNSYKGWRPEDLSQPGRWLDFETYPKQQRVTLVGPEPHAYPPPQRTVVIVGGEQTPTGKATRHAIAEWFRL